MLIAITIKTSPGFENAKKTNAKNHLHKKAKVQILAVGGLADGLADVARAPISSINTLSFWFEHVEQEKG